MSSTPTVRIAFFGTSSFVGFIRNARLLHRLIAGGVRPAVVVTAPDALDSRGREVSPSAVKSVALEFGLPVLQPETLKGFSEELGRHEIELSLVAAYGKILPPDVLAVPKFGSLNIHPSLLPRWRGPTPIQATILAGDAVTGVTVIRMDEKMDHGPIVARRELPLGGRNWTASELSDALADLGADLFLEILDPWVSGRMRPVPQDESQAAYTKLLKKEDGHIDWSKPAGHIERMIRALQPWPGAYTFWRSGRSVLRLNAERVEEQRANDEGRATGTVFQQDGHLAVQAGDGAILVRQLKPEGGKSMSGAAFLRGHAEISGTILA